MFFNPICHWASLEPDPIFEEDFRKPIGQLIYPFPTTLAQFAAKGVPPPTSVWDFEETSGNAIDHIGGRTFTMYGSPIQNKIAWGIPDGEGSWGWKKCVEFQARDTANYFELSSPNYFDVNNSSICGFMVCRCHFLDIQHTRPASSLYLSLLGKMENVPAVGWRGWGIGSGANNRQMTLTRSYSGSSGGNLFTYGSTCNAWVGLMFGFDFARGKIFSHEKSSWAEGNHPDFLMSTPNTALRLGAAQVYNGVNDNTSALCQIAYLAMWEGALAEAIVNPWDTLTRLLYKGSGVSPNEASYPNVFGRGSLGHAGIVGTIPGKGVHLRDCTNLDYVIDTNAGFSDPVKTGAKLIKNLIASSHCWDETDQFYDASWVKTNLTVSTANADLDDHPGQMLMAQKLTATADGGMMHHAATTGAVQCHFGLFYKRHSSMGANVGLHFRLKNLTSGLYEWDQALTATDEWQHFDIADTPAVTGCQIEISIDTSGDSLCCYRVYGTRGVPGMDFEGCLQVAGSNAPTRIDGVMPSVEAWIKSAQGEIEITYMHLRSAMVEDATLWDCGVNGSTGDWDSRWAYVESSNTRLYCDIFTGAGGYIHRIQGPAVADYNEVEHNLIWQWNNSVAQFGGFHTQLILDGVVYPGSAVPWAVDGTKLDKIFIGISNENTTTWLAEALVQRVRVWEFPWRHLP